MKSVSAIRQIGLILGTLAVLSVPASAWSQEPQYKANVPKSLITPDKVQILLDGWPADRGESRLVMATSLDRLFLRMRPFWGRS